jgi:site-specific recombinase XerD
MHHERIDDSKVFAWPSRDILNRRMKALCKKCGIKMLAEDKGQSKRYIHAFRHSAATHLVEAGVPLEHIGGLLNHRDLNTTKLYAKTTEKAISNAVSNLHTN